MSFPEPGKEDKSENCSHTSEAENMTDTVQKLKAAADQGDAQAQFDFAMCLYTGEGVAQDMVEGAHYFKLAADQGLVGAQLLLASCLQNGDGISIDLMEAARYLKMAADQGDAQAQFEYAMCLSKGEGVKPDSMEAARYFKMSADQGVEQAQLHYAKVLSIAHLSGLAAVDPREVARYYKMAADQGCAEALAEYGECLRMGVGVPVDTQEGLRYLKMAADKGNGKAQVNFADAAWCGIGMPADREQAAHYWKLAADQGFPKAQGTYGLCVANGYGVAKDPVQAFRYFKMAADQGDVLGEFRCGICYYTGSGVAKDFEMAARFFKMAADKGHPDAQVNYGVCLLEGNGVAKDLLMAAQYFKMAADQGHPDAHRRYQGTLFLLASGPETWEAVTAQESAPAQEILAPPVADQPVSTPPTGVRTPVEYVAKESKSLPEWIVDMNGLEEVKGDLILKGSEDMKLFKRKGDETLIVGKFLRTGNSETMSMQEISTLSRLDHPCIVKFAGYTPPCPSTDRRFLVFTEYVSGGSLSDVIAGQSYFPWFDSTGRTIIVIGIVLGMRYIHAQKIVHRDLRLGNVLIDENHHPHICDFGSSLSLCGDTTMASSPSAMIYYIPPELCAENVRYDEKMDVYSFGVMLYEIVTGNLALRELNQVQIPVFISQGKRPEIPKSVLPFAKALIERCWAQDPAQRPSFTEIYDDLLKENFLLFADVDTVSACEYAQSICRLEKPDPK